MPPQALTSESTPTFLDPQLRRRRLLAAALGAARRLLLLLLLLQREQLDHPAAAAATAAAGPGTPATRSPAAGRTASSSRTRSCGPFRCYRRPPGLPCRSAPRARPASAPVLGLRPGPPPRTRSADLGPTRLFSGAPVPAPSCRSLLLCTRSGLRGPGRRRRRGSWGRAAHPLARYLREGAMARGGRGRRPRRWRTCLGRLTSAAAAAPAWRSATASGPHASETSAGRFGSARLAAPCACAAAAAPLSDGK